MSEQSDPTKKERQLASQSVFYFFDIPHWRRARGTMQIPYMICDSRQPDGRKVIAQFQFKEDADAFLELRRNLYVEEGE